MIPLAAALLLATGGGNGCRVEGDDDMGIAEGLGPSLRPWLSKDMPELDAGSGFLADEGDLSVVRKSNKTGAFCSLLPDIRLVAIFPPTVLAVVLVVGKAVVVTYPWFNIGRDAGTDALRMLGTLPFGLSEPVCV